MKIFYNLIAFFIAISTFAQQQTVTYSISPAPLMKMNRLPLLLMEVASTNLRGVFQTMLCIFGPGHMILMMPIARIVLPMGLGLHPMRQTD
jgi:hypothetical protein